jgi:alpha-galactosidase
MSRKESPKIVVIGAASSSFSGLLADLVSSESLDGAQLVLVDIDAEGLDVMVRLGQRMAGEWGKKTTVEAADRKTALAGADFVITTIAVGGVESWRQDQEIPARHGYHGHSVDTVGPGGLFRGLRLIPPLLDVCRDVERLCPDAWVINYSNPMPGVCRAIAKATGVKVVGLCTAGHLPRQVARFMEIEPERVEVISGGLNHWVWALRVLVDGKDITKQFYDHMREKQAGGYYHSSVELLDAFGAWPMPGSSHVAEFHPYFYGPDDDGRASRYSFRKDELNFDAKLQRVREQRQALARQAQGAETLGHKPDESAGEAVEMLTSIWTGRRTRHHANVTNAGLIPNLPHEAIVEIPVLADSAGIRGLPVGPLPQSLVGIVAARCGYYELLADAAIHRSRHLALQCLLNDCLTTSLPRAKACVDAMFAAQAQWLEDYS